MDPEGITTMRTSKKLRIKFLIISQKRTVSRHVQYLVQVTSVQCPKPENPVNGKAVYTSYAYNSIVSYECKYGYTVVGAATRRCGADRKWTGKTPTCQEINCGLPGVLYNGWIENIEAGVLFKIDE